MGGYRSMKYVLLCVIPLLVVFLITIIAAIYDVPVRTINIAQVLIMAVGLVALLLATWLDNFKK